MKNLIASVLVLVPVLAFAAQPQTAPKKAAAKTTVVKKAAKPQAKKPVAKKAAVAGAGAAAVATAAVVAAPLGADEIAIAERVYTGRINCELGQHVNVNRDDKNPGHFRVDGQGFNFYMSPVATSTGVVRLEDKQAGAVWLQIANKSMLMNQKAGQRLADECMSTAQLQVAEAIKKNPQQNLLESVKPGQ